MSSQPFCDTSLVQALYLRGLKPIEAAFVGENGTDTLLLAKDGDLWLEYQVARRSSVAGRLEQVSEFPISSGKHCDPI